jgi:hypothetical protein
MKQLATGLAAMLAAGGTCLAQYETTLPDPFYATNEGNSNFVLPWNVGATGGRVQFCHDSTLFVATGMNGPIRIKGQRYRPDAIASSSVGGTYPSVVVDLQFTTPFVYDPMLGGDLLIEFVVNAGWTGAGPGAVDHVGPTGLPAALSSRVWISGAGAPTSPTGNASYSPAMNYCPVCELVYEPALGLWPNFAAASPTTGPTPLAVQFEDRSVTDDPAASWPGSGISTAMRRSTRRCRTRCSPTPRAAATTSR